jgi:hypothetical protein
MLDGKLSTILSAYAAAVHSFVIVTLYSTSDPASAFGAETDLFIAKNGVLIAKTNSSNNHVCFSAESFEKSQIETSNKGCNPVLGIVSGAFGRISTENLIEKVFQPSHEPKSNSILLGSVIEIHDELGIVDPDNDNQLKVVPEFVPSFVLNLTGFQYISFNDVLV